MSSSPAPSSPPTPPRSPSTPPRFPSARVPAPAPARRTLGEFSRELWTAHAAFLIVAGLLLLAIGTLTVMFHEVYEDVTDGGGVAAIDHPVMNAAIAIRGDVLTVLMQGVSAAGDKVGGTVVAVLLLAILCMARRDRVPLALMPAAMLGSVLITSMGKTSVGRVRPPHELALPPFETSPSFPSGHTLNATVLVGITLYLMAITPSLRIGGSHGRAVRWATAAAVAWAVLMGLSRVYLGAHWLTDVMAGWLVGVGWVLGIVLAHRAWLAVRRRPSVGSGPGTRVLNTPAE